MSLQDMRCDRCGELEQALYRAGPKGQLVPWYCEACMAATRQPLDNETKRLTETLKEHNERNDRESF